jgi:uncharacterized phage protein (TIGR01671 family)
MREIKFRGKDQWGNWRYGDLMKTSIPTASPVIVEEFYYDDPDDSMFEVDPATVGQFTGLLDSNGKEIYEGDIVRFELPPMVLTNEKTAVGVVVYEYGQFLVIIHAMRFTIFSIINDCTIIGNVHDSPELLEADNERD